MKSIKIGSNKIPLMIMNSQYSFSALNLIKESIYFLFNPYDVYLGKDGPFVQLTFLYHLAYIFLLCVICHH